MPGCARFSRTRTVRGFGASTASTCAYTALRGLVTPVGGKMTWSRLALTSRDVRTEPSWNLTPSRSLNSYTLPSGEMVQDSARSGTIFGYSKGSNFTRRL